MLGEPYSSRHRALRGDVYAGNVLAVGNGLLPHPITTVRQYSTILGSGVIAPPANRPSGSNTVNTTRSSSNSQ